MKTLTALIASSLFAVTAYAGDIYHGFAQSNPDLAVWDGSASMEMTGVQPGIGDVTRWSGGGNEGALFKSTSEGASEHVDIYGAFESQDVGSGGY